MSNLQQKQCVELTEDAKPLSDTLVKSYLSEVGGTWSLLDKKLVQTYTFPDFKEALVFVNRVAKIAEEQWHHPDIAISFNKVTLTLYTHSIGGLSENDFIMAAKISSINP